MKKSKGKYVYCFIRRPQSFDFNVPGMENSSVHLIESSGLAAVVSDMKQDYYPATKTNVISYQNVVEGVMRISNPVLPAIYGTVTEDIESIEEKILKEKREELMQALARFEGKVEYCLRGVWVDPSLIMKKIARTSPLLKSARERIAAAPLSIEEAIEIGRVMLDTRDSIKERIRDSALYTLEDVAEEYKVIPEVNEENIFNISVLVNKEKENEVGKIVAGLGKRHAKDKAFFKYVGPLPPYSFFDVRII